jgi:hypothetical protein
MYVRCYVKLKLEAADEEKQLFIKKLSKINQETIIRFGTTDKKNNIMRELAEICHHPDFVKTLNKEEYILPIEDGQIIDLRTNELRERTILNSFSILCPVRYVLNPIHEL